MMGLFNVILIETKNTCTRKCWFCKFGQERRDEEIVKMDWDTIERIVFNLKELNYRGRISWFWINEPLMEKRIFDILKFTKQHCSSAFLSLITNGDILNDTVYKRLRQSGLDALGVSVYDDKTFQKIEQMQNDQRLVMLDMRNPLPGHLENRAGNVKQQSDEFEAYQQEFLDQSCARPFSMMTVNPKGEVVLCCADMYSDVVMGDVHDARLEEIWNNERFAHYRKTLMERGRRGLKLCDGCSHAGTASTLFYPLDGEPKSSYFEAAGNRVRRMLELARDLASPAGDGGGAPVSASHRRST
jgi:radical SAM protein with 4Fe4S-binding SPASM domain